MRAADALRYLVATTSRAIMQRKLKKRGGVILLASFITYEHGRNGCLPPAELLSNL
jgi:hypothetical protein